MSKEESGFRTLLGSSEEEPKSTTSAAFAQIAFERIGLFAAVFGFALLLVKVSRVSHLNSRTSHALLSTVGPIEIVLGTLVTHFPSILFVIALLVTWWAMGSFAAAHTVTPGHAAAAATVLFAMLLLPWPFAVVLVVIGAVRFVHRSSRPAEKRGRAGYYLIVGAVAVLLVTDAEPWLPPEVFSLKDGSEILGYALAEAETNTGWTVVLEEGNRSVIRLPEESIASRNPCHLEDVHLELEQFASPLQLAIRESTDLPEPECPPSSPD
jgi:hypothetical protein